MLETTLELKNRNTITDTLEEVTGVQRHHWMQKNTRQQAEVRLRHIYAYLLYKYGGYKLKTVADLLNHKNHTTIIHSCKVVEEWLELPHFYKYENTIVKQFLELYEQRTENAFRISA